MVLAVYRDEDQTCGWNRALADIILWLGLKNDIPRYIAVCKAEQERVFERATY